MLVEHGGGGGHQPLEALGSHRGQTDARAVALARTAVWSERLGRGLRLALVLDSDRVARTPITELEPSVPSSS
jgi:hypothetical protein